MRRIRFDKFAVLLLPIFVLILIFLFGPLAGSIIKAERLPIKTYTSADGLAHDEVYRIVRDSKGFLWFCTAEGLSRFDGARFVNYDVDQGLPRRQVHDLLEAKDGTYWIATGQGLVRFNPGAASKSGANGKPGDRERFTVFYPGEDKDS